MDWNGVELAQPCCELYATGRKIALQRFELVFSILSVYRCDSVVTESQKPRRHGGHTEIHGENRRGVGLTCHRRFVAGGFSAPPTSLAKIGKRSGYLETARLSRSRAAMLPKPRPG